jgi:hypothetical protein
MSAGTARNRVCAITDAAVNVSRAVEIRRIASCRNIDHYYRPVFGEASCVVGTAQDELFEKGNGLDVGRNRIAQSH